MARVPQRRRNRGRGDFGPSARRCGGMSKVRRAVVTGAGGFIGSHLVDKLIDRGWPTLALVRYVSSGSIGFLANRPSDPKLEIARGDVRDSGFVAPLLREGDVVFHLAAHISIPYSYEGP